MSKYVENTGALDPKNTYRPVFVCNKITHNQVKVEPYNQV